MRDILVKLYVDEREKYMIDEMAWAAKLPVNRYLRDILCEKAFENGFVRKDACLFERIYTKRTE